MLHQETRPIVITDLIMPEMNGLELCRAIRQADSIGFVYVILLTANADREHLLEAFDAGADDFLAKPLEPAEMLARLKAATRIVALEETLASKNRELNKTNAELAILNEKLDRLATIDELTELFNRRHALMRLEEYAANARRTGQPMACVLVDIDHFKLVNDTHGHDVGDVVLHEIAQALSGSARSGEVVCRLGGEEFLVVCPNATVEMAMVLAERLRIAVESLVIRCNSLELRVTVSAGVAELDPEMEGWKELLKHADQQLYEAKKAGRNRIVAARPLALPCQSATGRMANSS
jgi:diguanylate cyclase (GGDEF)-like protein